MASNTLPLSTSYPYLLNKLNTSGQSSLAVKQALNLKSFLSYFSSSTCLIVSGLGHLPVLVKPLTSVNSAVTSFLIIIYILIYSLTIVTKPAFQVFVVVSNNSINSPNFVNYIHNNNI